MRDKSLAIFNNVQVVKLSQQRIKEETIMFYVKEKINEAMEVRIELGSDNVYGICPGCGDEVQVNLEDLSAADDGLDLYGMAVYCDDCTKELMKGKK